EATGWRAHRLPHVLLCLRLREGCAIDALDNGSASGAVRERLVPDNIAAQVASRLAVPYNVRPSAPNVIGEYEPLKIGSPKIFEMNALYGSGWQVHGEFDSLGMVRAAGLEPAQRFRAEGF